MMQNYKIFYATTITGNCKGYASFHTRLSKMCLHTLIFSQNIQNKSAIIRDSLFNEMRFNNEFHQIIENITDSAQ